MILNRTNRPQKEDDTIDPHKSQAASKMLSLVLLVYPSDISSLIFKSREVSPINFNHVGGLFMKGHLGIFSADRHDALYLVIDN